MPELPEVETVTRGLRFLLPGKKISNVTFCYEKAVLIENRQGHFVPNHNDILRLLDNSTVVSVERRAKHIIVGLDNNYSMIIHLKMTGQMVIRGQKNFGAGHPNNSLVGNLPDNSTRVIFDFTDGTVLYFNDQRKFGWIKLVPTIRVSDQDYFKSIGPEPLNPLFDAENFIRQLRRRNKSKIKPVLLDQTIIAGVGNIYADESLWAAGIHPETPVEKISETQLNTLFNELRKVLQVSIDNGGSTDKNYVDVSGKRGSYLQFANVFRRQNTPCPRCGRTITKLKVAGRGTHICPSCQVIRKGGLS